ncbi:ADP-ribosylglycohydrolase family protein [Marinobacterium sediminicola]|uniref:ADP-ribosylglycohydrolase n=1 Tax=Marinobacterium sediminicola TaxID=518898 RepID=A0ABY1RXF9_9GAMM|nr:ADP-ribosylglycohydrolase family protein [Marinobacterium sediminicola]ULG67760.1 ADP-ribosylglycohydrolase family protein [Marinobacterium sediminicola]SMR71593.1 ADP-ribosylglycohydrolase [Marinobacterium sediminicola]
MPTMIEPARVASLIQAALVADSFALGLHWIYDHHLLDSQPLPTDQLNAPMSHWHCTKAAGDLTHYGDQLWHLYQYLQQHQTLDIDHYRSEWSKFMANYHGFLDKASATTLANICQGITPSGSPSTELSVTARVACPLLYAKSSQCYLDDVEQLARLTHDSDVAVASCRFFASVLLDCLNGKSIAESVAANLICLPEALRRVARAGIASSQEDTRTVLRQFGIACDTRYGLPGVMHLIHRYQDPLAMLQENVLAGGDSSARGMISVMLLIAEQPERLQRLPQQWLEALLNNEKYFDLYQPIV